MNARIFLLPAALLASGVAVATPVTADGQRLVGYAKPEILEPGPFPAAAEQIVPDDRVSYFGPLQPLMIRLPSAASSTGPGSVDVPEAADAATRPLQLYRLLADEDEPEWVHARRGSEDRGEPRHHRIPVHIGHPDREHGGSGGTGGNGGESGGVTPVPLPPALPLLAAALALLGLAGLATRRA